MPESVEQITNRYEKELIKRQRRVAERINNLINQLITEIAPLAAIQRLPKGVFSLAKLNILNSRVDAALQQLLKQVDGLVRNGIMDAWDLSNKKNNLFADKRLDGSLIPPGKRLIYYDANAAGLQKYLERQVGGLGLSDRVYAAGEQLKAELEAGLGVGIAKGQSAAALGRNLKQYLKNPNALFRRVRDAKGVLRLSKNAKAFHPGQGVYRSATKNIQRLTRTETNMAYRSADMARFAQTPFITGYTVKLSAQHPKYDICDSMKGDYPVTFKFIGWHPHCICFCIPKLMNEQEFNQYQQMVLAGTDSQANVAKISNRVMTIPDSASKWISENKERVAGWKNTPFWWQQNPSFVPELKAA